MAERYVRVVRRGGRVTIPVEIRRALGIGEGSLLAFRVEGGRIVVEKVGPPEPGGPAGRGASGELAKELGRARGARR